MDHRPKYKMQNYKTRRSGMGEKLDGLGFGNDIKYNTKGTPHERKNWKARLH